MAPRYRPVPAESYTTSPFGPRWGTVHRGMDFGRSGGSANMPVYAAQGGTVVHTGAASGFGGPDPAGWVVIDHPTADGSGTTVYGHIIREVSLGQRVEAGQRIGRVNPSPATNGNVDPHLHFEVHERVWLPGSQLDPAVWLAGALMPGGDNAEATETNAVSDGVLFGVDVSEHQDGMSLTRAAAEGIAYAIVRTTDGTYRDRTYRSHIEDAENGGLVTAAYHYLRAPSEGTSVAEQVAASVAVMGDLCRPVWIDVETEAGVHVNDIRECKRRFEDAGVRVIGCYSYVPYWENRVKPGEPDSHEFGAFWVAAYGANRSGKPSVLYPGNSHRQWDYPLGNQRPAVWQFGSRGLVAGYAVDVNAFRGTRDQLRALFYGVPLDPETAPPSTAPEPVTDPPPAPPVVIGPVAAPVERPKPAADDDGGVKRTLMDILLSALVTLIVGRRPRP